MSRNILDLIDGAIEGWEISQDAMRWTPEPVEPMSVLVPDWQMLEGHHGVLIDTFTRTVSNGWDSADTGQTWTVTAGVASDFSVTSTTLDAWLAERSQPMRPPSSSASILGPSAGGPEHEVSSHCAGSASEDPSSPSGPSTR